MADVEVAGGGEDVAGGGVGLGDGELESGFSTAVRV